MIVLIKDVSTKDWCVCVSGSISTSSSSSTSVSTKQKVITVIEEIVDGRVVSSSESISQSSTVA